MTEEHGPFLSAPELARRLGVSETTAHNWRRALGDLIPTRVGRDGVRRFALRRYEEIQALRERNLPLSAIRDALRDQAPVPEEGEPRPSVEERQTAALERIAAAVERIAERLERAGG